MRRHAKAASAGSTMRQANGLGRIFRCAAATGVDASGARGSSAPFFLLAIVAAAIMSLLVAPRAGAATVTGRPLLFSFNGAAGPQPLVGPSSIAIDNATGDVFVGNDGSTNQFIEKFDSNGNPVNFSATGSPVLALDTPPVTFGGIAVDNSGGANQGRILAALFASSTLRSFAPSGEEQWRLTPPSQPSDVALDATGHPYLLAGNSITAFEYANTGSPPSQISTFTAFGGVINVDANGNVYIGGQPVRKYVGGVESGTLDPFATGVYSDQTSSSGHIFTVGAPVGEEQEAQVSATAGQFRLTFGGDQTPDLPYNATAAQVKTALEALASVGSGNVFVGATTKEGINKFTISFGGALDNTDVEQTTCQNGTTPLSGGTGCAVSTAVQGASVGDIEEYDASGTLLGTSGSEYIVNGRDIAYSHALDRVYVLDGSSVEVFGPSVTGTVADATIESPSAIGVSTAHFSGKVNPQGTSSEWRFQWRKSGQSWLEGGSSPAQSLPVDSSEHTVEYTTNALRGGNNYEVRLIAVNTSNKLAGVSESEAFATPKALQAPAVTINAPSSIGAHSVKISGTVNPQGDTADWRVQTSTDPACATGFSNQPLQQVTPASASAVNVEYEVTGLLGGQHYCARILATNSAGTNEAQELVVDATAGTYKLSFEGKTSGWTGEGKLTANSSTVTEVSTSGGTPVAGEAIFGSGIKPNTTIAEYNATTKKIFLSQPAESSVPASKAPLFTALPYDATAYTVQSVLNALPSIGGADGSVTVTGGPGNEGGTNPYEITFTGSGFGNKALAEKNVPQITTANVQLSGGAATATTSTIANGVPGSTASEVKQFETLDTTPTQVFTAYAAPRTDTTARLNGYVNPEGSTLTYRFEYSQDGTNWTALPDLVSSRRSREQIVIGEEVTGLQPNTTYHYRFSVENGGGVEEGEEKEFTTRTSAEVQSPARGIELVNPPDKGNQNIGFMPNGTPVVAPDGNRVLWQLLAGAPGGNSGTYVNFISDRTPSGWASRSVIPPAEEQVGEGGLAHVLNTATPDLRHFVMRAQQTEAGNFGPPIFVRLDDAQQEEVLESLPETPANYVEYGGAEVTGDGSHVLWVNYETQQLEELDGADSEVVSIMPEGQASECGLISSYFSGINGGTGAGGSGTQWRVGYHRMATTDASRVYFQSVPNGQPCGGKTAIFYRDRNAGETIEVDSATSTEPEMIRATPDGKSLYFVTGNSHVAGDTNGVRDVYSWDAEGGQYTCLTCVVAAAEARGPVLVSDDFSHVYFISTNQLVPGHGKAGDPSLYVVRDGEVGFVADLGSGGDLSRSELSANGNVLSWYQEQGKSQLTADETAAHCPSLAKGAPPENCREVFRYEDGTESVECISCAPSGTTERSIGGAAALAIPALFQQSGDGTTTVFVTSQPLLASDINNAPDVYESRNGVVRLVTDGETPFIAQGTYTAPKVYTIDETGDNIFFTVLDKGLTGYEQDGQANLYDARAGGGFPRPQPPEHCSEESCQGPLQAPPGQPSSGSSGLAGAGNVAPVSKGRCAAKKGKARSRCLHKKHKHHKRRGKKRAAKTNAGGAK